MMQLGVETSTDGRKALGSERLQLLEELTLYQRDPFEERRIGALAGSRLPGEREVVEHGEQPFDHTRTVNLKLVVGFTREPRCGVFYRLVHVTSARRAQLDELALFFFKALLQLGGLSGRAARYGRPRERIALRRLVVIEQSHVRPHQTLLAAQTPGSRFDRVLPGG